MDGGRDGGRPGPGRGRIIEAAIRCFAERSVAGTSLKTVATEAGVSQALIVHHFGSKDGLREACDGQVIDAIRTQIRASAEAGAQLDLLEAFRRGQEGHAWALPYLARALAEGGASAVALVDELAEASVAATEQNVAEGRYRPSEHPRERALVLVIWSLGAVVLHRHVQRLLAADLTGEPRDLVPYLRGATEVLAGGLFTPEMHDGVRAAISDLEQE